MFYSLKNYQRDAVDELKEYFNLYINKFNKTIVFKSPTGSGKTFMMSALFEEVVEEYKEDNFCFIWASIGKGELQIQSYKSVQNYLGGNPKCSLLEDEFFGSRSFIKKHEIVFVNWEKLVQKNKETGKWINTLMMDQEGQSFLDVLENTRNNDTKIILVVDESHIGANSSTRIREFRNCIIKPNITIEMSATPLTEAIDVEVPTQRVIDEGMIKEDVIVNEGIKKGDISIADTDSELLILNKGYEKRIEIKNEYEKIGSKVNPLVLIQIPNVDAGEAKKEVINDFLRERGITEENGKLKYWCDEKGCFDKFGIKNLEDETEYLVFKTAVATGWDCPRAQILIKFREGTSETFEIQTIGRILRTAEAKSYSNKLLDNAYIFTNIQEFETKQDTYSPNRIKTEFSYLKDNITKIDTKDLLELTSYYRSREGDYNAADSRFSKYFEAEFMSFFGFEEKDKYNLWSSNEQKLLSKGIDLALETDDMLIEETNIGYVDNLPRVKGEQAIVKMSEADIQAAFNNLVKENLSGLAYVRSKGSVNMAFIDAFSKFYDRFKRSERIKSIQRIVIQNKNIFADILNKASSNFREMLKTSSTKKGIYYDFSIEDKKGYSTDTHTLLESTKSIYQPLYVLMTDKTSGSINKLEAEFIEYMDSCDDIKWFWENGPELMQTNFGIPYKQGSSTFQPDFLIKFNDGRVGIFDTKPIGFNIEDTTLKAEALYKYIEAANSDKERNNEIIGGIIIKKGNVFYVSASEEYTDYNIDNSRWISFTEFISRGTK